MGTKVIPGMEDVKIEALDEAIERYVEARDRRMELTKVETAAKQALEKHMQENKKETYRHSEGHLVCVIEDGETKMKVKAVSDEEGGEGAED